MLNTSKVDVDLLTSSVSICPSEVSCILCLQTPWTDFFRSWPMQHLFEAVSGPHRYPSYCLFVLMEFSE